MRLRTIIGLAVIIIGLFWVQIQERIPDIVPDNTPSVVITIDEPSQEIKEKVSSIADLVTDEKDRLNLCIFNKVFAERVGSYDADAQQINDVYTEAAKIFFGETLKGKYAFEMNMAMHDQTQDGAVNRFKKALSDYSLIKVKIQTLEIIKNQVQNFGTNDEDKVNTNNDANRPEA